MKSFVDQDACIACGLCVSTCEDVYHFNEEGKAEAVEGIISAEYEDDCRTAAENCPTMAIEIDEGQIFSPSKSKKESTKFPIRNRFA